MKRLLVLACATLVASGALAQDNFKDVPQGHWAYDAVLKLKQEGLLKGYPDGTFKGSRPATRYELAAMLHGVNAHFLGITDSLRGQLNGPLQRPVQDLATRADLASMMRSIDEIRLQVNSMKGWRDEISGLKSQFGSIGENLSDIRRQLDELKGNVKKTGG